jgi:hypothetical protein
MPPRRTNPRRGATRATTAPLDDFDDEPGNGGLAAFAPWLAVAALVVAVVALAATLLNRPPDLSACRSAAWAAVPAASKLPAGWTLGSTDLNANGLTISFMGPVATDGSGNQPTVYAGVTCYGDAADLAMARNDDAARAAGGSVTSVDYGDESFEVASSTGSKTTFIRVAGLIGQVADANAAGIDDLKTITNALAASMRDATLRGGAALGSPGAAGATSGNPSANGVPGGSASPSEGATGSGSPLPSGSPSVLEGLLPSSVNTIQLTIQSGTATDLFGGTDPGSRALTAVVRSLGAKIADMEVAQAFDQSQTIDLAIIGFRLPGQDGAKLRTAILETWLSADAAGVKQTQVTLGGKRLTKVDYGDGGTVEYVFGGPDYVIVVDTADAAIAAKVAAQLK